MLRTFYIAAAIAVLAIVGVIGYCAAMNPVQRAYQSVDTELARIQPEEVQFEPPVWDFKAWHQTIIGKPALWNEVVMPPAPKAPDAPKPPSIDEMLKGVEPTRVTIGGRVKIKTDEDPKGTLYSVGDTVNGTKITEIAKEYVEFSFSWKGQELTKKIER
jgi:hypothetical protein